MGIEIPGDLQWVAQYLLGAGDWPDGDETAMRRVADGWTAMANTLNTVDDDAAAVLNVVLSAISEGETHTSIQTFRDKLLSGDQATFTAVRQWCEKQAELLEDGANDIEHTKLTIIGTMIVTAVSLVAAFATSWTGVGAAAGVAARVAAQVAIRAAIKQLIARMLTRGAAKAAARLALRGAAFEALEEGGVDLAARMIQVSNGDRTAEKFGVSDFVLATFGGAVGGAVGGVLGGGTGALGDVASSAVGKAASKVAGGAVTELGADLSAQVATAGVGAAFLDREFKLDIGVDTFTSAGAGGVQSALESGARGGNSTAPTVPELGSTAPGSNTPASTGTLSDGGTPARPGTDNDAPTAPAGADTGSPTNSAPTTSSGTDAGSPTAPASTGDPGAAAPNTPESPTSGDPSSSGLNTNGANGTPTSGDAGPSNPDSNSAGVTDTSRGADTAAPPSTPNSAASPESQPGDSSPAVTANATTPIETPTTGDTTPTTPNSNGPSTSPNPGDTPSSTPVDTATPTTNNPVTDAPATPPASDPTTAPESARPTGSLDLPPQSDLPTGQQNPSTDPPSNTGQPGTTPSNPQTPPPAATTTPESAPQPATSTPTTTNPSPSITSPPSTLTNNPDTSRPPATDTSTAAATTTLSPPAGTPTPTTALTTPPTTAPTTAQPSPTPPSFVQGQSPLPRTTSAPPRTTAMSAPAAVPAAPVAASPTAPSIDQATAVTPPAPAETLTTTASDSHPSSSPAQATPQTTTPTPTPTPNQLPDPGYSPDARPLREALRNQPPHDGRTTTVGTNHNPSQPRPSYRIRRFQVGNRWVSVAAVRAYIPNMHLMTPAELNQEIEFAQHAVDSAFNHVQDLLSGDQFLVDLELTTDPNAADLQLNLQQHAFDLANDLRAHMGLPRSAPDTPLSPDDLRAISNDIARANTPSPLPDMPSTRVFAPRYLRAVELPQYQHAVEDALRDGNRFTVGADPRINLYGGLINDGGPHVPGRNINCLDASLAALSSFNGRPEVAAPRTTDLNADGTVSRRGEEHGPGRAASWLGGQWQTFANTNQSVPQQFQALHDWISQMGPGSSALVINGWQAGGSHASTIVYPIGATGPVWWDPQQATFSDTPPASLTSQSTSFTFMTVDQQGAANGTSTTPNSGTTAGVPGSDIPGTGVQRAPEQARVDLPRDSDTGGDRGGDGSGPGELRSEQGDRGSHHPVESGIGDDRGNVRHSDRNGELDPGRTGLPATESTDTPTDPARPGDDRIPGDGRVDSDNAADNRRPASDNQQGDFGNHSVHNPGTDGGSAGSVESAAQRHVADNGDIRDVVGTTEPTSALTPPGALTSQELANADQARYARESLRAGTPENNQTVRVNPYGGRPYQVARYPNALGQPVQVVRLTTHIASDPNLPPAALDAITESIHRTIDHNLNQGHQFSNGDWVMVDVVPVTNPNDADLHLDPSNTPATELADAVRQHLGLPPQNIPGLTSNDIRQLAADIDRATMTGAPQPSWADQHATTPETPVDTQSAVDLDAIHNNHAEQTPAGVSHHRGDPTMGDLPHRVPADPNRFTADTHITPDGHAVIGGQTLTPEQYGDLLRRSGWDGVIPIRLIGCDASTNGFADRLAQHLGVEVLAPTHAAWTDANGNVFSASTITNLDGTRSPRIPPDGQWQTHHPNGTTTTTDTNSSVPGSRATKLDPTTAVGRATPTPRRVTPAGARDRSLDPHAQQVRDEARLRTGGRDALTSNSPARELTRSDVECIERIEGLRDDLNRPTVDPAVTRAKLRAELEDAGVLRDGKQVLRNDGPAMERRALMTRAGLDVNAVADEIGLRRPPPARTDNEGLPLRGQHADPAAVPRRDVTFAEVDAIVPDKLIRALAKFGVSREVAVQYIVDNHNDRSRQRYLPDLEGLARQYGIPHGDVLVIDLYTTKLYYEELNRRLRDDDDIDSVGELQQAVNDSLSKLPPAAVPELYRSLSVEPRKLADFLATYTTDAVLPWDAFTSVADEVGGTWWEQQPGENILFQVRGGVAYDISDFADGLHYLDPPNSGRELLLPAGRVVRVESVTPHVLPDGTTGYVIELQVVGSAGPTSTATP